MPTPDPARASINADKLRSIARDTDAGRAPWLLSAAELLEEYIEADTFGALGQPAPDESPVVGVGCDLRLDEVAGVAAQAAAAATTYTVDVDAEQALAGVRHHLAATLKSLAAVSIPHAALAHLVGAAVASGLDLATVLDPVDES